MDKRIGNYSFALGVMLAVVLGLASSMEISQEIKGAFTSILIILGIIVGMLNVTTKETKDFLLAAIVLIIAAAIAGGQTILGSIGSIGVFEIGTFLSSLFSSILLFTIPAVIVVSVKQIWFITKTK